MKAYRLQQIDREFDMHLQAWHNHRVTATKQVGDKVVSVYKSFKDFFDYEARLNEVLKPKSKLTPKMRNMARIAAKINSERR